MLVASGGISMWIHKQVWVLPPDAMCNKPVGTLLTCTYLGQHHSVELVGWALEPMNDPYCTVGGLVLLVTGDPATYSPVHMKETNCNKCSYHISLCGHT